MSTAVKTELIKLAPGTYRLTRDVKNPDGDGRKRGDFECLKVWPAGMEVIVREEWMMVPVGDSEERRITWTEIHPVSPLNGRGRLRDRDAGYQALVPALEACDESLNAMFARLGVDSKANARFLKWCVSEGWISRRMFETLYQKWEERGIIETSMLFADRD